MKKILALLRKLREEPDKSNKEKDEKLEKLLAGLSDLIESKGPGSEEVRKFVRENWSVEEFPELAATYIFMVEEESCNEKEED